MDKLALIGDIHSNLTALQTVLEDIKNRNISEIICLGDLISKGVNPDLVIDLIRENCNIIIKGNCDEIYSSQRAIERKFWTTMKIGEERVKFLKQLPSMYEFYISGKLVRLFHSSPYSLEHMYNPIFNNEKTRYSNYEIKEPMEMFVNTEFIGKNKNDRVPDIIGYAHTYSANLLEFEDKIIFNTGSVGLSSNIANASYTIIEGAYNSKEKDKISITNIKIPYDVLKELKYIEQSDIPTKEELLLTFKSYEGGK